MSTSGWLAIAAFSLGASLGDAHATAQSFAYARSLASVLEADTTVIDARPVATCRERSLAGARCIAADELLGPHRRLPAARDLLWLLGTAGLTGSESVLVVGQEPTGRDFVAAMLYLAGQHRVRILAEPIERVLAHPGVATGPGRERAFVREKVFEAPMRDQLLILRDELRGELRDASRAARPAPALVDGRRDGEYWGETVRAVRTGHLPGAISLPAAQLRAGLAVAGGPAPLLPPGEVVAYAHDAYEGMAYFALLAAGHGVAARLYAEGWAEWASDGTLPVDAAGHPERAAIDRDAGRRADTVARDRPEWLPWPPAPAMVAAALALLLAAFAGGWWVSSRRTAR